MELTVAICTYKPRTDYLNRVLAALRRQTLPTERWELLLIDNASPEPVQESFDLSWHPNGHQLREDQVGKANALRRAYHAARGNLLVVVDDDNILADDYLANSLRHFEKEARLGCCGPATIVPEFEVEPAPELKPYLHLIAVFSNPNDRVSFKWEGVPAGAGCVYRKSALGKYFEFLARDPRLRLFGTTGGTLLRGEDVDMAEMIIEQGYCYGMFLDLKLTHLIPKFRVTKEYLMKLTQGFATSSILHNWTKGGPGYARNVLQEGWHLLRLSRLPGVHREFALAYWRGEREGRSIIAKWKAKHGPGRAA